MLRAEMSCWASDVGTGIQSRNRPASFGYSFARTVYLNSMARDAPGPGASAETAAARPAAAARAVTTIATFRPRMRRIIPSGFLEVEQGEDSLPFLVRLGERRSSLRHAASARVLGLLA